MDHNGPNNPFFVYVNHYYWSSTAETSVQATGTIYYIMPIVMGAVVHYELNSRWNEKQGSYAMYSTV